MRFTTSIAPLFFSCALVAAGTARVQAEEPAAACDTVSAAHAHTLAEEARRKGEHRRAAECYRLAGEPLEADRALANAFVEASVASTKKASATIDDAKAQARRVREAFRARPAAPRG